MLKIKELFEKQYNLFKKEYQKVCDRLPVSQQELENEEVFLRANYDFYDVHFNNNGCAFKYLELKHEVEDLKEKIPILLNKLNKINEILNNGEHIISLQRNQLDKFSRGKIILEVGKSAIGNSKSNVSGKINGDISGSSILGFGDINGSLDGYIKGNSKSHYEEYILVKYKYNLDYEIEEFLFNINDYLVEGDEQ